MSDTLLIAITSAVTAGVTALITVGGQWAGNANRTRTDLTLDERKAIREATATQIQELHLSIERLTAELGRMTVDRDKWRELFIETLRTAEHATDALETTKAQP